MSQQKLQIKLTRRGEIVRDALQGVAAFATVYLMIVLFCAAVAV